jgi:hypothetical protein
MVADVIDYLVTVATADDSYVAAQKSTASDTLAR